MINFSTLQGLAIPDGTVTQITDASGRVLWSAVKEIITGTLILRPSADLSVGHGLYPANSANAYSLINEEVSDGNSTYIYTKNMSNTSKFRLSGEPQHKITKITSITIKGEPYNESTSNAGSNTFYLFIDGVNVASTTHDSSKEIDTTLLAGIVEINEYLAKNGELPAIDLEIRTSAYTNTSGSKTYDSGVSQVYVVLAYETY